MDPGTGRTTSTLLSAGYNLAGGIPLEEWRLLLAEESPVPAL